MYFLSSDVVYTCFLTNPLLMYCSAYELPHLSLTLYFSFNIFFSSYKLYDLEQGYKAFCASNLFICKTRFKILPPTVTN